MRNVLKIESAGSDVARNQNAAASAFKSVDRALAPSFVLFCIEGFAVDVFIFEFRCDVFDLIAAARKDKHFLHVEGGKKLFQRIDFIAAFGVDRPVRNALPEHVFFRHRKRFAFGKKGFYGFRHRSRTSDDLHVFRKKRNEGCKVVFDLFFDEPIDFIEHRSAQSVQF